MPVAAAVPGASGGSWTAFQAEPTEVVVGQLPVASPADMRAPGKRHQRPLRVRDAAALAAAKRSPKGPKGTSIPRSPGGALAASQAASTLPGSFNGISNSQQITRWEPPDTQLAAGPTTLMELVNSIGRVFNKSGGGVTGTFSLGTWFGLSSAYEAGDPRVLFDHLTQRWYATVMGFDPTAGGSKVVLAVSTSSNPAGTWRRYVVYSSSTLLCDQPKLGYSSDKFLIGCTAFNVNIAPPNDFIGGVLIVASKTQALAGQTVTIGLTSPDINLGGLVPAQNMQSGKPAYIVFNESTAAGLITITGDPATGLGNVVPTLNNILMTSTSPPVNAPQLGATSQIDTGDDRFMSAVLQGGKLWTSAGAQCIPSGDTVNRSCIKVLEIGVVAHTNDLDTISGMNGKYLYYPTLGIDANGNLAIGYGLSSTTDYPSHGVMIQPVGQTTLTDKGILQGGGGAYAPNSDSIHRWGDYGAVATDPARPTRLWVAGEYAIGPDWGTGISAVDFTSLTLSPTGIGFGSELLGRTTGSQALTLTNSGDFDVQVSSSLSSGDVSQFSVVDNACASALLAPTGTCTAHFTFKPTTAGDQQARFNISAPHFGPLALVLSGTGVGQVCASTSISPDVTSPKNVGTAVTLNATSGCPDLNPLYQFWLQSPAGAWSIVQSFSTSSSFPWNTSAYAPGTYLIGVWVKDAQSVKRYDAYAYGTFTLQRPPCTSTNVGPELASPQPSGTTVTFTAAAIGCPTPIYQWLLNKTGVWTVIPGHDFAHSSATYVWNTAGLPNGTYQVGVWAKQKYSTRSYEAYAFVTYTLAVVSGTIHCQAVNIGGTPPSPSVKGTIVSFVATTPISCDTPEYQWLILDTSGVWKTVQAYPGTNTYTFATASRPAGTYLIGLWVRQSGSTARYEAYSFITYTVTNPPVQNCTSVNLGPDLASPQPPGTTVTFTAAALGCSSATYQFLVLAPGSTVWTIKQPFGAPNTYAWNTSGFTPGTWQIGVWARQAGSTAAYQSYAFVTFQLRSPIVPCATMTVDTAPGQIVPAGGGSIQFTAIESGCATPVYTLYLRRGTGANVFVGYLDGGLHVFTVGLAGMASGTWTAQVLVKDFQEPNSYDVFTLTDFVVN